MYLILLFYNNFKIVKFKFQLNEVNLYDYAEYSR